MKKIALVGLLASALSLLAQTLPPLCADGTSVWTVQIPAQPDPAEAYAAEELQAALQKMSGVKLEIRAQDEPAAVHTVVIGSLATSSEVRGQAERLQLRADTVEQLAVCTLDGKLYLAGNQPRGALYAVYSFLQQELGCRWFWPGDDGEFIEARARVELPELARHERPGFRFREMTPCWLHYHVPTEIWMARNLLNGGSRTHAIRDKAGFHRLGGGHQVSLSEKQFAEHPEWFSLINGKRDAHGQAGCWANPDFTRFIVDKLVAYARENRLEILNTFPADITQRCECAECQAISPDPSARWFIYYAQLIRAIRQELPELLFAGIAYQEYRTVPVTPVEGLEYVEHCQYSRCYVHQLDNQGCELNQKTQDELLRWQARAPMGIYGYEFDPFTPSMYQPCWNMLADEIRRYRDLGLVRMKTELSVRYPREASRAELPQQAHRLPNYLYARLLWNPDLKPDELIRDWCEKIHGPAAAAMQAYHLAMAGAWDGMVGHLTYFGAKPDGTAAVLLNDELIKTCHEHFAKALAQVGDDPQWVRARQEIALEQALFSQWEKLYHLTKANAQTACLSRLEPTADAFDRVPRLPMRSRKGTHHPAEARMFWSETALHLQVRAQEPAMADFRRGQPGRDGNLWQDDIIECFLDFNDGSTYSHFACNAAGGFYDARGTQKGWQPEWQHQFELGESGWRATLTLPFAALGRTPTPDEQWRIVLIRGGRPEACAFPAPAYHDLNAAANLYFSAHARPERRLTWISRNRPAGQKSRYDNLRSTFLKNGWQSQHALGVEEAMALDFSDSSLIVIENYQNPFPPEFYRDQLIPAVRRGAVVVFSCYFWVDKLHEQFADPTYAMAFVEKAHRSRKPVTFGGGSFATEPHDLRQSLKTTPSGYFEPVHPESWTVLATQYNSENAERPFLLARPLGQGMVVLSGDFYGQVELLDNLLDYARRPQP